MRVRFLPIIVTCLVVLACGDEPLEPTLDRIDPSANVHAGGGPPSHAVVQFGREKQGTDFFPPGSHDASFNAKDAIRPRTVVISAGGTVDFVITAAHFLALYEPGVAPADIDVSLLEPPGTPFPFPPLINDPDRRIVRGPPLHFGPPTTWSWTFDQPGKYLVICQVLPHFVDANMYAWVDVK